MYSKNASMVDGRSRKQKKLRTKKSTKIQQIINQKNFKMSTILKIWNAICKFTKWFRKVKPVFDEVLPEKKNSEQALNAVNLNSGELLKRHEFPGTPFTGVCENGIYILTMGMYRMAEKNFNSFDEIEEYINTNMWNLILLIAIIANKHKNDIKEN